MEQKFIDWLKTQNLNDKYSFNGRENCALAQFGRYYLQHDQVYGSAISFKDYKNKKEYVIWPSGESSDGSTYLKVRALIRSKTFGELLIELEKLNV